ncbi:hypothetical protein ACFCYN_24000 [Gottfriedia sp. NPDC056225]|uniref:hypothetical protein n=1 Tax=Gottfriedia sp. NPDC056225 TaxID=3345751 RepID=UPI0035D99377
MLNVSNSFMKNMMGNNRVIDSYIMVNLSTKYDSMQIINWSFHDTISVSEVFEIGTTIANSFEITLQNTNGITNGMLIEPYIGVNVGGSTIEYVSLGKFNVIDTEIINNYGSTQLHLTCLDNMIKLDVPYLWTGGATDTISNIMSKLSSYSGVPLAGTYPATIVNQSTGYTCRQMLGFMAGLLGGNGAMDRVGRITIKKLTSPVENNSFVGGSTSKLTFDSNIANYVKGQFYDLTVNTASRTVWDGLGVKVNDFITNGNVLTGINPSLGTITGINGYVITIRADVTQTDSTPAQVSAENIGRRNSTVMTIAGDNYFDFKEGNESYIIDKITGYDFNGNSFSNGTVSNNKELRIKNPFFTQALVESLATSLIGIPFFTFNMEWQGNPALESGDNIRIDEFGVSAWNTIVTDTVLTYPDFGASSQTVCESQLDNKTNIIDNTGETVNNPELINGSITGGMIVNTNSAGTMSPNFNNGYFGLHMKNQDIRGVNALVFNDETDNSSEGILFPKNGAASDSVNISDYQSLRTVNSQLLFDTNRVIHEGNVIIQTGAVSITPVANTPTSIAVTYPKPFPTLPSVQVTPNTGVPESEVKMVSFGNPTVNGFNAFIYRTNTNATTLYWVAIWGNS